MSGEGWLGGDEAAMILALVVAAESGSLEEVPVGAVLRDGGGRYLAQEGNATLVASDPTGHAEMRVLRRAAARVGDPRLTGSVMSVTLEPCPMCRAATGEARVSRVDYAARRFRPVGVLPVIARHGHDSTCQVAGQLLASFFARLRKVDG